MHECDKCGGPVICVGSQWEVHWDTEKVCLVEIYKCVKCDRIFARKRPPQEIGRLS